MTDEGTDRQTDRIAISISQVSLLTRDKRTLISLIRERQVTWVGHVMCGDTLLKDTLEGSIKGKKQSGNVDQ